MVIKPVEFAMIQQQNNVAKSQYNAENRPMTERQTITQRGSEGHQCSLTAG